MNKKKNAVGEELAIEIVFLNRKYRSFGTYHMY